MIYSRLDWRAAFADQRGVTAIEFAIVGPIFILTVLMIMQFALEIFSQATLDYGNSMASRQVELGYVKDDASFKAILCKYAHTLGADCAASATVSAAAGTSFATQTTPNYGSSGNVVTMTVSYPMPYLTPWIGKVLGGSGSTLVSVNSFQAEPY